MLPLSASVSLHLPSPLPHSAFLCLSLLLQLMTIWIIFALVKFTRIVCWHFVCSHPLHLYLPLSLAGRNPVLPFISYVDSRNVYDFSAQCANTSTMDQRPTPTPTITQTPYPNPLCIPIPTTSTRGLTLGNAAWPRNRSGRGSISPFTVCPHGTFYCRFLFFSSFHLINRLLIINFALGFY